MWLVCKTALHVRGCGEDIGGLMAAECDIERKECFHIQGLLEVGFPSRAHADRRNESPYRFSEGNELAYTSTVSIIVQRTSIHTAKKQEERLVRLSNRVKPDVNVPRGLHCSPSPPAHYARA
jgi:hypothetical protein